ncbi:ABC transporter permease [Nocardiopsis rhodophaea]|uniref:ABC transporter permease n=2 Tax=Nocardiopsis rhodophaea TaxID=280238 RepID=A0ABN2TB02_9ACTN
MVAVRAGIFRGWLEFRQSFTTPQDVLGYFGPVGFFLGLSLFMRGQNVGDTDVPIAAMWISGLLGFLVATSGLVSVAQILASDREDGTLLRAKAAPKGMVGYLVGRSVHIFLISLTTSIIILAPSHFIFDGFGADGLGAWLTFAWVLPLGLLSTAPVGAVIGSMISNPRTATAVMMIPSMALLGISGIIYQVSGFPVWLQWIAQVFPLYWVGLGMRSVFLPDTMLPVELGESWRHLETAGVLSVWAIAGFVVATFFLNRMARREAGSRMEEGRRKAMQRA